MVRLSLICALAIVGCDASLGPPVAQPIPEPDGVAPLLGQGARSARIAHYRLEASLDVETRRISARERLRWTNPAGRPVNTLPFHLYMNAFKNQDTLFMRQARGRHRGAVASETAWGWIDLHSVIIDGTDVSDDLRFPGPDGDETVVELPLPAPLAPGAQVTVDIAFEVQLPEVFARTGYKDEFMMVGQWFPKIGVLSGPHGAETWHCKPFYLHSEFFADFGVYDVAITVPHTHVVAATGVLTRARDNGDGTRTLTYRAEDVHDFAWMADPYMKVVKATAVTDLGEVEVQVYHRAPQEVFARRHLAAGVDSIEAFSRLLIPYPWPIMRIIVPPPKAAAGAGGMEYPTLVTTTSGSVSAPSGFHQPEYVTVHEVGHNWFQGILASNEVEEAWLDEGVNVYIDSVVMDMLFGKKTSMIDWQGLYGNHAATLGVIGGPMAAIPAPIVTPSYEFPDWSSYIAATYQKTGVALRTLENIVGPEAFRQALRTYAQRFAFQHPTGADFFATLEEELGPEVGQFLEAAFNGIGAVDYAVRSVDCQQHHPPRGVFGRGDQRRTVSTADAPTGDTWQCDVLLVNLGTVAAPVDVLVVFEDGTDRRQRWQATDAQPWQRYHFEHTAPITEVVIDPDQDILLNDSLGKRAWRRDSNTEPSRRATGRIQYWLQTAMQVFGI